MAFMLIFKRAYLKTLISYFDELLTFFLLISCFLFLVSFLAIHNILKQFVNPSASLSGADTHAYDTVFVTTAFHFVKQLD